MNLDDICEMGSVQLRVTAAELAGWRYDGCGNWLSPDGTEFQALYPTGSFGDKTVGFGKYEEEVPPDPVTDLNAIHDMWKTLDQHGRERFETILRKLVCRQCGETCEVYTAPMVTNAGALARVRAFIFAASNERIPQFWLDQPG